MPSHGEALLTIARLCGDSAKEYVLEMCSTRSPKCLNFKTNQQVSPLGPITS